jgi:RimJ/RimL family protein N-acetyltransferase
MGAKMVTTNLLQGEAVRLTALDEADLATLVGWQQDAEFLRLFDARPAYPQTEQALKAWLQERQRATDAFFFAIRRCESDDLLGYVELDSILWAHGSAWLSIATGERGTWGRGFGTEAVRLVLGFAFGELNLHRVQLTVFAYNQRAIALYRKLGFQHEGTYREALHRDGQRHDMLLYGLLRREWEALNLGRPTTDG